MTSSLKTDIKEDFYQSLHTLTLRLRPPERLLPDLETNIDIDSVSLTIRGEEVWRTDLFSSVVSINSSAKLSGKWIEIHLNKETPAMWPELKRYVPKVKEVAKGSQENGVQIKDPVTTDSVVESSQSNNSEMPRMDTSPVPPVPESSADVEMNDSTQSESVKKSKLDDQSNNENSEHSSVAKETPHSSVAKETPDSTVAKETPHSSVAKENGSADQETKTNSQLPGAEERAGVKILSQNKTGLENIGNTCFINSGLQCLINCLPLRDFFIGGEYCKQVNTKNKLGYSGELARAFHELVVKMWVKGEKKCAPRYLKYLISLKNKTFSEYGQQDSHEYLTYLLDGLHEDLNRVKDKPLTSQIEAKGREDKLVAAEAWETHRERNDSFIIDNFQGQFKSTLVCPKCRKVSVTFDPFMSISVPLPRKMRLFTVHMIWRDLEIEPRKFKLPLLTDASLELVKASLGRKIDIPMIKLRIFETYRGKIQEYMKDDDNQIESILDSDVIIVTEVLSEAQMDEKVVEVPFLQRTFTPRKPTKCAQCQKTEGMVELKRCTKCLSVAYCGRNCQSHHWPQHQASCRAMSDYSVIGLPFIVSLPQSKWTYRNIAVEAMRLGSRSVAVEYCPELPKQVDESLSIDVFKFSAFSIRAVNNFGATVPKQNPLNSLDLDTIIKDKFDFLSLDWKTDTKLDAYVKLTELNVNFVEDESMKLEEVEEPKVLTLEHCLQEFSEPETLTAEEAWYCSQCKQHREATKMLSLWKLPPILIIQLKRFFFRNVQYREYKLVAHVKYPVHNLDMSRFCMRENGGQLKYDLFGVINHQGCTTGGHYVAFANADPHNRKGWMGYDDSIIRPISIKDVVTDRAYILFYKLRPE